MDPLDIDQQQILGVLGARGLASSHDLQVALGKSQPTVSRLLGQLASHVLTLGRARSTRYGLPKSIRGFPAQQPMWWTSEDGHVRRVGTLSLLATDLVHVESEFGTSLARGSLPWYLSPLHAQGFLGRLLAQRLASTGVDPNPERWGPESVLLGAIHLHDAPGSMTVGDPPGEPVRHGTVPLQPKQMVAVLDELAQDVARTLPAGSSAGGEQPKFLAVLEDGRHVLVKFTPPGSTPFGSRWHDLLHAEVLAAEVLADHGVEVARSFIAQGPVRTYLVSERFDRIGPRGRRHVVSVGAAHNAFVSDAYAHWSATCDSLARQNRLAQRDAARVDALRQFGRLIGNTDMHSGNLGLFVQYESLAKGVFTLAPTYDMLPMRWRPDAVHGGAADYSPFEPDAQSASGPAVRPARDFWLRLADEGRVSRALRNVARDMARRIGHPG